MRLSIAKILSHMLLFRYTLIISNNYDGTITNEKSRLMFRLALYKVIKKERYQMMMSQERVLNINKVI